jgi:hypothetical protein
MSTIEVSRTLSDEHTVYEPQHVAADEDLVSMPPTELSERGAWDLMIDTYLLEWVRDTSQLASPEDGIRGPSSETVARAIRVAGALRDSRWAGPIRVAPNGEGGIVFERRAGEFFQMVEVGEDGAVFLTTFCNRRFQSRERISV